MNELKWIKCSEQKPPYRKKVFLINENDFFVGILKIIDDYFFWAIGGGTIYYNYFTHWAIPEFPDE